MRFGLCTSDPERLRQLRDWGYDFAEIGARALVPFEGEPAFAAARERLAESSVPIEALSGFIPGAVPVIGPTVDWGQVRGYLETTIGRAAAVGVRVINWGSVESRKVPPGWPFSRAWEQIEHAAALIAEVAAANGVTVVVEAVNPREANVLYYLTDALHLVRQIDRPSLKVIVDYYHVVKQDEPLEHVALVASEIAHCHTSDDARRFPALNGWDQRPFLRALAAAGYDGRLSFESRDPGDLPFEEAARRSVQRMRQLHGEIGAAKG